MTQVSVNQVLGFFYFEKGTGFGAGF
jgi:hypothetical protein